MRYLSGNKRTQGLQPGDEIGGTRIIWTNHFYDKSGDKIGLYIGINPKSKYVLFISDSSNVLTRIGKKSKKIKNLILESFKIMKARTRVSHPGFDRGNPNYPEGNTRRSRK